jgi:hypothetical protein
MTNLFKTPTGGTKAPTPKPAPRHGPAPMSSWRQPVGGVRSGVPPR